VTASADGGRLASCDESGILRVWPSIDAAAPLTFERAGARATMSQFSVNGTRLFVAWDDGTVELRDGRTAQHLTYAHAHEGGIASLAQSADGRLLVSAGNDSTVRVWDAATLKSITSLSPAKGTVQAAALSPDGRALAVAESRQIELWDTRSWERGEPLGRSQRWFDAAFSHNGDRLVTASDSGMLRVWEPRATTVVASEQRSDGNAAAADVQRMAHAVSGNSIRASVGSEGALRIMNAADGTLLMTPLERDVGGRLAVVQPDGRVAVAWDDGRIDIVDLHRFDRHVQGNEAYQRSRLAKP